MTWGSDRKVRTELLPRTALPFLPENFQVFIGAVQEGRNMRQYLLLAQVQIRKPLEKCFQGYFSFQASKRRTNAHMGTVPKSKVATGLALPIQFVGTQKYFRITIGSTVEEQHLSARRNWLCH